MSAEAYLDRISGLEDWLRAETDQLNLTLQGLEKQFAEREPELWQNYCAVQKERIDIYTRTQKQIDEFKALVIPEVMTAKATIRGTALMAVYSKPATTWDGAKLQGYAVAHPEVIQCANVAEQGKVSFRKV
jgi:hypothetical protein